MKKLSIILSVGMLAMASCSNDDLVVNSGGGNEGNSETIGFAVHTPNMGRANLQTEYLDFGVNAFKGNTLAAKTTPSVMEDYLVGYWTGTEGYKPLAGQTDNNGGSNWFYDGLGNLQIGDWTDNDGASHTASYEYVTNAIQATAHQSLNDRQYLRYWDLSKTYTYFMACAPYRIATFDATANTYTFPEINEANTTSESYLFAATRASNSAHAKVPLAFQRLAAQIRLAFYEEIPGYDVEIIDLYPEAIATAQTPAETAIDGIYFAPADAGTPYTVGKYTSKATPVVTFSEDAAKTNGMNWSVTYTGAATSTSPIIWATNAFTKNGVAATKMGYSNAADQLLVSPTRLVIPADATTSAKNSGFTLMVSFKLTAHNSGETIGVYGAKVYVDPTYTQWAPNCRYTYVFRITTGLPGTTTETKPDVTKLDPTPAGALFPIIFDDITVDEYQEQISHEWDLN